MGTYMVHVQLHVSWLLLHGSFFSTKFLLDLADWYCCFMLISKGTRSCKCNFCWFEHLPCFWTWWNMDIQGHVEGFSTHSSVIIWHFFKPFILEIGLINSYKMPPCLLSYLMRALCILTQKIWLELDSPYFLHLVQIAVTKNIMWAELCDILMMSSWIPTYIMRVIIFKIANFLNFWT